MEEDVEIVSRISRLVVVADEVGVDQRQDSEGADDEICVREKPSFFLIKS